MQTKIVYVLSSDDKDIFVEQLILSSYSLKLHNPTCHAVIVVDDTTEKNLVGERMRIMDYIDERIVVETPSGLSKKEVSRYLKTTLREYIEGSYLFIDSDTIVCGPLELIDQCPHDIAAVLDTHNLIDEGKIWELAVIGHPMLKEQDKKYYNSGVMYVQDTPRSHELYKVWYQYWNEWRIRKNIIIDQPTLAKANSGMGYIIKELDGAWNCQIVNNGLRFLYKAYIIHYFNARIGSSSYYFANMDVFRQIRKNNYIIPINVQQNVKEAKSAFASQCEILAGEKLNLYRGILVQFVYAQYLYHRWFYNLLLKMVCLYQAMVKCLKRL